MYEDDFNDVVSAGKDKVAFLKNNPLGFMLSSMLAGLYVGLGIILIYTIGGILNEVGSAATRIVMGLGFASALSLVMFAGSDLFTGSILAAGSASLKGELAWSETFKLWTVTWVGNLLGSVLIGVMFYFTGHATGAVGEFIGATSQAKMNVPFMHLLFRGIFCNILVCAAVWSAYRCKEETSKLIMFFWCCFIILTAGFEHSIANMSLFTIGLLAPNGASVSIMGYIYNVGVATIGNIIGGLFFIAIPYFIMSKKVK